MHVPSRRPHTHAPRLRRLSQYARITGDAACTAEYACGVSLHLSAWNVVHVTAASTPPYTRFQQQLLRMMEREEIECLTRFRVQGATILGECSGDFW